MLDARDLWLSTGAVMLEPFIFSRSIVVTVVGCIDVDLSRLIFLALLG
jgi:hypothetical protein